MDTYSQLTARAQRIGYHITKVVYRGYEASASLQATHDNAVQTRTYIRLNKEAEEKEQILLQFKLKREKQRTKLSEWPWQGIETREPLNFDLSFISIPLSNFYKERLFIGVKYFTMQLIRGT